MDCAYEAIINSPEGCCLRFQCREDNHVRGEHQHQHQFHFTKSLYRIPHLSWVPVFGLQATFHKFARIDAISIILVC